MFLDNKETIVANLAPQVLTDILIQIRNDTENKTLYTLELGRLISSELEDYACPNGLARMSPETRVVWNRFSKLLKNYSDIIGICLTGCQQEVE